MTLAGPPKARNLVRGASAPPLLPTLLPFPAWLHSLLAHTHTTELYHMHMSPYDTEIIMPSSVCVCVRVCVLHPLLWMLPHVMPATGIWHLSAAVNGDIIVL